MSTSVYASIDLGALKDNLQLVRSLAPCSNVLAVIKANAYGHGLVPIAAALKNADALAVARCEEALQLRDAGITARLVVMGGTMTSADIAALNQNNIDITVHHPEQLGLLMREPLLKPANIWLKFDSGMHRLGFTREDFINAYQQLSTHPQIKQRILMTHFASADNIASDFTQMQWESFLNTTANINEPISAANSAALLAWPHTRGDWVRPGIMLFGADPLQNPTWESRRLRPVMQLQSTLIALRRINTNETVGYNNTWRAQRPSTIGTIAIGYGDGYPRHASNGTPIWICGKRAPLAGRVSMDMITVDLTDIPQARIGDTVELWGPHISVNEVAQYANTISYELLTSVNARVKFRYIQSASTYSDTADTTLSSYAE